MRSADPQTQGRYQAEFEREFAAFFNQPRAFAVSSCTSALELSALLCRLNGGDESYFRRTRCGVHVPFARTGAKLVWADIDPRTHLVTSKTIEPLITPRTRVIVAVHLYGLTCDMDPIMTLARNIARWWSRTRPKHWVRGTADAKAAASVILDASASTRTKISRLWAKEECWW